MTSTTSLGRAIWDPKFIIGDESRSLKIAEEAHRALKIWHQNAGLYHLAGEFHYREWLCRTKNEFHLTRIALKNRKLTEILFFLSRGIPLLLTNTLFGYGERWVRVLFWWFFIIFGFSLIYYLWCPHFYDSYSMALYYSGASFTSLGYIGLFSNLLGWAKGVSVIESIFGAILIALFLVTFVRKFSRL